MTDDTEFDLLMEMTDAELAAEEAALDREIEEQERRIASWPIARQVAYHRGASLRIICDNRRRLRDPALNTIPFITERWRESMRRSQRYLVKLRIWRATGAFPGEG
jgi:hypothetical protein